MELKKTFIAGKMNKDLDERLVPDGEYIDALNVTIDTTSGSNIGAVSNSLGNTIVTNIQQLVENEGITYVGSNAKTIGAVTYEADNLIYWLVTSDTFDAIFEYSELFQFTSIVLLWDKSATSPLNFSKNYPVTGINYIPVSKDEGPFLYWTDGLNQPRRINISRAKSYITNDPRIAYDIDVILRPPLYGPRIDLSVSNSINTSNNIEEKFIYFSYRFKYKDSQYSSLSPFSSVAFHASGFAYDINTGDNKGMLNRYNKVDVIFDTGNEFVEEIQVLYFDTYRLNVYIVGNYDKSDIGIDDESKYSITFSANKIYTPLESGEVTRLFDNVPLSAKAQEIIGNRLVYGNYVQFRDIVNADGVKIIPNYTLSLEDEIIPIMPKKTFRSDRDYEIGIIYLDEYGRMTTALTSKENSIYIPPTKSDKANSIKVTLTSEPPAWATNYRFAIKQSQGDYYNIFPKSFVIDDVFRYFLINESDRDKISVGNYIIFKSSGGLATGSSKQFKILELEYKQANAPFTTEGLYFKIKADANDIFLGNSIPIVYGDSGIGYGINYDYPYIENAVQFRSSDVEFDYAYYSNTGNNEIIYPYQNDSGSITAEFNGLSSDIDVDYRLTILITNPSNPTSTIGTHFKWTIQLNGSGYSSDISISDYVDISLISTNDFRLYFDIYSNYYTDDLHIVNIRGGTGPIRYSTTVQGFISSSFLNGLWPNNNIDVDYRGHSILIYNGPIYLGANIDITIVSDYPGSSSGQPSRNITNTWVSNNYYKNIEEWFWQSGAYSSFQFIDSGGSTITSAKNIIFRKALVPPGKTYVASFGGVNTNVIVDDPINGHMCMLIRGQGNPQYEGTPINAWLPNVISSILQITQSPPIKLAAETVPLVSDIDLFYEMRRTYRIENGNHKLSWRWNDYTYGGAWPDVPSQFDNFTVLGPASPFTDTANDMMHWFNAGERVYVRNDDPLAAFGPPSGYYNILYVINEYAIIIDLGILPSGYAIGSVFYQSWESDQDLEATPSPIPLVLELNNVTSDNSDFNAFAFGNGVESYRIYDNFLRPTMKYSPRATSVIEDYKQEEKMASLCYSGIFKGDTSTNRLNSFNLSQANFKNLDKQYGPIQKLYAQDTNLMVLQQDKITSVLYGKNLLVDAVGGGQVASVPEVLGNQIVHPSEYGISNNPESFAKFANTVFFTDARRGAVLQMTGDQVVEISANGMKNYFRDELKDNPNTQKLGIYDPYNETYVLSFTDVKQGICQLSLSQTSRLVPRLTYGNSYFMFSIQSNVYWTITLQDAGNGTDWLSIAIDSGYGDQDIYANIDTNNATLRDRYVYFVVEYCDGLTQTFTLFQNGTEL